MFKNIGSTIKTLSLILGALGIVGSLVGGFSILDDHMPELAISLTAIIGGSLGSLAVTIFGYGLGVLVEQVCILTDATLNEYAQRDATRERPAAPQEKTPSKSRKEDGKTERKDDVDPSPRPPQVAPSFEKDDVEYMYRFAEGYYEVSTCKNNLTHVGVASEYREKPVKAIGQMAFSGKEELKRVILPAGIEQIGARAFRACKSLEEMPLPQSLSRIDSSAFSFCTNLRSITIPQGVERMGDTVFSGCKRLTDIYCAAPEKPAGWSEHWNAYCDATVHWGSVEE